MIKQFFWNPRLKSVKNKHVVITGGSSGIGKCVAIIAARHGANVTIIARDVQRLETVKNEILHACENKDVQRVEYLSLDIGANYENVEKALADLEKTMGPIYMLVNCAGVAICGKIEDTTVDSLDKMIHINLLGTYYCIKAVVQRMKASREGAIVVTSSQAAFLDTPGFAVEELSKPLETRLISQTSTLVRPEVVADKLFKDALAGKFFSSVGLEGFILTTLCSGMSPFKSISELFLQASLMGLLRIVSAFYLISFEKIILNCMRTRDKNKKSE
ncbi:3-ketodihydrosphingosine reductase-like protein [Lasius niger]|uniref:3-ketodihydrosphingosine reductase-like protein n=1 Tax=Lasius niger TaxID=67767 RepID=A0A0J7L813_LASNI|nr:3-ketodihydrosphingosine reductase-like protein [Lasius niger]